MSSAITLEQHSQSKPSVHASLQSEAATQVFAIINPVAGSCEKEDLSRTLTDKLGKALVGIHYTSKTDDFGSLLRQAEQAGAQIILVAGGDGTVSQVASHLVHRPLGLLIIPAGTANVMAKALQLPFECEKSLELLKNHHTVKFDAIEAKGKYYFSHVSVGVYSNIAEQTPPSAKRLFGRAAYIWNGIKAVLKQRNWPFELILDGKPKRIRASTVMIANVGEMGAGGMQWGPGISPTDGTLNVSVIQSKTWLHYLHLAWEVLRFKDRAPSQMRHFDFKQSLEVRPARPLAVRGDGEMVGRAPIKLNLVRSAIRVLVPVPAGS